MAGSIQRGRNHQAVHETGAGGINPERELPDDIYVYKITFTDAEGVEQEYLGHKTYLGRGLCECG